MRMYKLRHKPSGLYFTPARWIGARDGGYVRSNLHASGKTYAQRPSIDKLGGAIYDPDNRPAGRRNVVRSEWEIVVFDVVEVGTEDPR